MEVKIIYVVYDHDRNKWIANAYDTFDRDECTQEIEIVSNMPKRHKSWHVAVDVARRKLKSCSHVVKNNVPYYIFDSTSQTEPTRIVYRTPYEILETPPD